MGFAYYRIQFLQYCVSIKFERTLNLLIELIILKISNYVFRVCPVLYSTGKPFSFKKVFNLLLYSQMNLTKASRFFTNKPVVIGTFVSIGITLIVILLLVVFRLSKRRRRTTMPYNLDSSEQSKLETVSEWTPPVPEFSQSEAARSSLSLSPQKIVSEKIPEVYSGKTSPLLLSADNSTLASSSKSEPAPAPWQNRLRQEADNLRVQELQYAANTSNQGMHTAMASTMAHLRSSESPSQSNSDWARGLNDKPPPSYGTA